MRRRDGPVTFCWWHSESSPWHNCLPIILQSSIIFFYSLMWWCRSRLYFSSINGLMKASTVYISLVKMYYIFQTQCLRYNTSIQKSLKLVGNEIIFYWWLHPCSLHTCMQVYNRWYLSNRILNNVWHPNVASLPFVQKVMRQHFDVKPFYLYPWHEWSI